MTAMDKMVAVDILYICGFDEPLSGVFYWVIQIEGDATFYKVNAKSVRAALGGGRYITERRRLKPLSAAEHNVVFRDKRRVTKTTTQKEAQPVERHHMTRR